MNMSKQLYLMMLENSTSNSLCGDFSKDIKGQTEVTCEERVSGDWAIMVLTAKNIKPEDWSVDTNNSIGYTKKETTSFMKTTLGLTKNLKLKI